MLEKLLKVFEVILISVDVFELLIPFTAPPVPDEVKPEKVFPLIVIDVAVLTVEPIVKPVMAPCPAMLVTVLLDRLETPFQ